MLRLPPPPPRSFEESYNPCTLSFVAVAVEKFGTKNADIENSFCQLLAHITTTTCTHVQTRTIPNCPALVTSFFDLCQRVLLFCPAALVKNAQFGLLYQVRAGERLPPPARASSVREA